MTTESSGSPDNPIGLIVCIIGVFCDQITAGDWLRSSNFHQLTVDYTILTRSLVKET
jgi:hypothetical protein